MQARAAILDVICGPDPGQWVVVQAPVSPGWNSAELARFASGVQVLVTAQQGRG